jgi:hypothetical protein
VHPNGSFVYTFAVNINNTPLPLEGYSLDASGNIAALAGSPFSNLANPFGGKFDQGGTHLVCPLNSSTFAAFSVDTTTGAVTNPISNLSATNDGNFTVTN